MSLPKIILPNQTYFITTNVKNRQWNFVDRSTQKAISNMCNILIHNLKYYRNKFGFALYGFVVMPDHIHLLLQVSQKGTISDVMRDWKGRTSYEINRNFNGRKHVWQADFWTYAVRDQKDVEIKLNYIHQNPVRAGLVDRPEDWQYSSARWYAGMDSDIEIDEMII